MKLEQIREIISDVIGHYENVEIYDRFSNVGVRMIGERSCWTMALLHDLVAVCGIYKFHYFIDDKGICIYDLDSIDEQL